MADPISVYHGLDENERRRLNEEIKRAYVSAADSQTAAVKDEDDETPEPPTHEGEIPEIPEFPDLIGIDPSVYRQINGALKAGKRHLMLYGPPGTGKTTLAQKIATRLQPNWYMITGSADWSIARCDRRIPARRSR